MLSTFGEGGLQSIQAMGIMNSMKTGNAHIDMVLAMLVPLAIGMILGWISKFQEYFENIEWYTLFCRMMTRRYTRTIKHSTISNSWATTNLNGDTKNDILIKAIQLYLDNQGILNLTNAELELRQLAAKVTNHSWHYDSDDDNEGNKTTMADTLSKYKVTQKPCKNTWIKIGNFGKENQLVELFLVETVTEKTTGGTSENTHRSLTLDFQSKGKTSIDTFIDKAYKWYLDQLRSLEDDSRYYYDLSGSASSTDGSQDNQDNNGNHTQIQEYKRYKLSDEKTFESLFFREKESVLKIVDHFTNKSGKYAIKGYRQTLGVLLHGPPGTGKTSLIKALAHHTGRSIVNVPLARISTNAELASLFFDSKYYIEGESVPINLGFEDVIFVMEDVDAVSKVVRRRDGMRSSEVNHTAEVEKLTNKSLWTLFVESTHEDCQELVKLLIQKSKRLKDATNNCKSNIKAAVDRLNSVPGLSLIGSPSENEVTESIVSEALGNADRSIEKYTKVDDFLGKQAKLLLEMLKGGAELSNELEDDLLGLSKNNQHSHRNGCIVPLDKPSSKRKVSESERAGGIGFEVGPEVGISTTDIGSNPNKIETGFASALSAWNKPKKKDDLNLSGLLNVLDGIVDTPRRMLIMTSNCPEDLDPALIRPGRIDKKLMLGYLAYEDMVLMIEHFFQLKLSEIQVDRLQKAVEIPSLKLTPAEVEQLSCTYDDVEDMIVAIERKKDDLPMM